MTALEWKVAIGSDEVSAVYEGPTEGSTVFVCAHGAGGSISDRSTLSSANAMRKHGMGVVRFNFIYREKGRGGPDKMPKLMDTFRAVVAQARDRKSVV